jgi:UDP-glucuronate 4-epimerase
MRVLITGSAGFIGFHTVKKYVESGHSVTGIDNINDYYSIELKYSRLKEAGIEESDIPYNQLIKSVKWPGYQFAKIDLVDGNAMMKLFKEEQFDMVIHLAAQAGVRYSLENPGAYAQSNVVGFLNILEACRHNHITKLIYASSSSVYGMSEKPLLSTSDRVDNPISLYAATKKSNELMAHVYSHLYNIQTIGLRFFTVYGPWGRPDMAPFLFTDAILNDKPIKVFNHGNMKRDFTYVGDIVDGIYGISNSKLEGQYHIFNIGNNAPVKLLDFINCIEKELQKNALKEMMELQPGDVVATWADTSDFVKASGYKPSVNIDQGVKEFINWYKDYYNVNLNA